MVKKIKAVNIVSEEVEKADVETAVENIAEENDGKQEIIIEESNTDPGIAEIIETKTDNPIPSKKMITCPDCNRSMLEKNFRYKHIHTCGKVRNTKKARPIEEVIEEKRQKVATNIQTEETKPIPKLEVVEQAPPPPPPPIAKPDYWALRREYTNQLKERKNQMVKRLVSKAF